MTKESVKIVMADDHVLIRDSLATLINSFENFNVTGVAEDGIALLELLKKENKPDIILLDINMPNLNGHETAIELQRTYPDVKILVLTMYDSDVVLIRMLQMGVKGFLKKDIIPAELKIALESVACGGYHYSSTATGKLASFIHRAHLTQLSIDKALLSDVEIQFLKLASTDMTYKEIALIMKLTPRSVDSYRDSLFEKLDVKSRVGLVIYAIKNGLVTV